MILACDQKLTASRSLG